MSGEVVSAAQAELERGRLSEALILQHTAILASPQSALEWHTLGTIHERLGALEEARAAYEEALRLEPSNGAVAVALARAEFGVGLEASASARVRGLLPDQFSDAGAAEECICLLLEQGDVTHAMQLLEKVALGRRSEMRLAAASLIGGHAQLASAFFRTASEQYHHQARARCSVIPRDRPKIEFAHVPLDIVGSGRPGDMVVEVHHGRAQIAFTARFRKVPLWVRHILLGRAAITLPLLWSVASVRRGKQTFHASLSDRGGPKMLSFCASDDSYLIPDPDFMGSFGYEHFRRNIFSRWEDWRRRRPVVIWRGGANSIIKPRPTVYGTDFTWNPRLNLCQKAEQSGHAHMLDMGITKLPEAFRGDPMTERKKLERFIKPYVPMDAQMEYKYLVDIDGWTNAWSGLFKKLLMGAVVLKVSSLGGFRQWYYDRLSPFGNFIPVKGDLSDLDYVISWAETHPKETEQIAASARELATSMTFADETSATVRRVAEVVYC